MIKVTTGTRIYNLEEMEDGSYEWQEAQKDGKHLGYTHKEFENPEEALKHLAEQVNEE